MEQLEQPSIILEEQVKKTYTDSVKKALIKYRNKNVEKYNELQRKYYDEAKQDDEWRQKFNQRCKENNKKYREKKRLEHTPKPRGRPRKAIPKVVIDEIEHIEV